MSVVAAGFMGAAPESTAIVLPNRPQSTRVLRVAPDGNGSVEPLTAEPVQRFRAIACTVVAKRTGHGLLVHGNWPAIGHGETIRLAEACARPITDGDLPTLRDALVSCIASVSADSAAGVSRVAWSRIARRDSPFEEITAHGRDGTRQVVQPTVVTPGQQADWSVIVEQPSTSVSALVKKLESGLVNERIDNRDGLDAYVLWSPRIAVLAAKLRKAGVTITAPAELDAAVHLVRLSGRHFASTMEKHLGVAGHWADEMALEYLGRRLVGGLARLVIDRDILLALLLVALEPARYPLVGPPEVSRWIPTAELSEFARRHRPPAANDTASPEGRRSE